MRDFGSVKHFWRWLVPGPIKNLVWRLMRLDWTLLSGIRIILEHRSDWYVYNEIFVNGEYDSAIHEMIGDAPAGRPWITLDLGAHAGFFLARLCDLYYHQRQSMPPVSAILVEGSAKTFARLQRLMSASGYAGITVSLHHGLAGQKEGSGYLAESTSEATNQITPIAAGPGETVPYLNLDRICAASPEIDLLKCDIEGAEFALIDQYPELLAKVRRAVIEFHSEEGDIPAALRKLASYGFTRQTPVRSWPLTSVYYLSRERA